MSEANDARRMKGLAVGVVLFVFGIINAWYVWYRYDSRDPVIFILGHLHFEIGHAVFWMVLGAGIFAWFWFDLTDDDDQDGRNPGG